MTRKNNHSCLMLQGIKNHCHPLQQWLCKHQCSGRDLPTCWASLSEKLSAILDPVFAGPVAGSWGERHCISPSLGISEWYEENWELGCPHRDVPTVNHFPWFPDGSLNWSSRWGWASWDWNTESSMVSDVLLARAGSFSSSMAHVGCCCHSLAKHSSSTSSLWHLSVVFLGYALLGLRFMVGHWKAFCCSENRWPDSCRGWAALIINCTCEKRFDFFPRFLSRS